MAPSTIRYATREDVDTILEMIQELADYEKESSSNKATPEGLLATVTFADSALSSTSKLSADTLSNLSNLPSTSAQKPARCLLIFNESEKPAGMALYFYNYSTWRARPGIYLEDLYVRESDRKKGYGKKLLIQLAKEVVAMDGGRLEWSVLKWNEPSIKFYESDAVGATMMSEWVGMRVDGEALKKLAASDV